MACGSALREVKKTDISVVAFDETLQSSWRTGRNQRWEQRQQGREETRQAEQEAWRARYDAYILSREWKIKRSLVFKRAHGQCEGCGLDTAVQVHHLTYAHLGDEFLWELRAVCRTCHERVHGKENA
jgi:5-methylcytosine-specific restriction endonuclease McrA